jgi:hypothetical protein
MAGAQEQPIIAGELRKTAELSHLLMGQIVAAIQTPIHLKIVQEEMCRVRGHHSTRYLKTALRRTVCATAVLVVRRTIPQTALMLMVRHRRKTVRP